MLNHSPLDRAFAALADPARRSMLQRLSISPASVSELAKPLPMSLAAVVQHLQVLESAGLVASVKTGRIRTCRLQPAALNAAQRWIEEQKREWERRLDRLGDFLAAEEATPSPDDVGSSPDKPIKKTDKPIKKTQRKRP